MKPLILVPVQSHIEPACEESLSRLERSGFTVRRVRGYAAIDQGRNQMATDALLEGCEGTLWIDSDIGFQVEDVLRLLSHDLPIVCGIYPQKGKRTLASHLLPGTKELVFGAGGGLVEILYAATGFLYVRRDVYLTIREQTPLPTCNTRFGRPTIPFFQPLVIPDNRPRREDEGDDPSATWYLAEDFAFCERARRCGYHIMADTKIRLRHYGGYGYSWEDAGQDMPRFANYHFHVA